MVLSLGRPVKITLEAGRQTYEANEVVTAAWLES
jgi:hypothetical protein